jgi:hypothetical protein
MKLAVFSESPADEAGIRVLVDHLIGSPTEAVDLGNIRMRGWQGVTSQLRAVIRFVHYNTDADGLVVVIDSDLTPVHTRSHEAEGGEDPRCRLCWLQREAAEFIPTLRGRQGRAPLRVAAGLAVPAIEAWYRCGHDARLSEVAWAQAMQARRFHYTKESLKKDVYGHARGNLDTLFIPPAREEALRVAQDLARLEEDFPGGFGSLAREVKSWLADHEGTV